MQQSNGPYLFFMKVDPSGNCQWVQRTGTSADHASNWCHTACSDGTNIFFGGTYNEDLSFASVSLPHDSGNCYGYDMCMHSFIVKFNQSGQALWARKGAGNSYDGCTALDADSLGNVYATGYFEEPSVTFGNKSCYNSNPWAGKDIYVTKFDVSGTPQWVKGAGGADDDWPNALAVTNENIFAGGFFSGNYIEFDSLRVSGPWARDCNFFLADLGNTFTSSNEISADNYISIFPNPTNGILHIESSENIRSIVIKDMLGNLVLEETPGSKLETVNLSQPAGAYIIEILSDGRYETRKIILQ
jgi:hypothetical protein